jgi:hypothetical protein
MVAILAEPTLILVFVGITLRAKSMRPFVVNHLLVSNWAAYFSPATSFWSPLFSSFFSSRPTECRSIRTHISKCTIGEALDAFTPQEGANYFANSGYRT